MAKVLVIGGTGLISSGVVAQATKAGHDVTIMTRGVRAAPENVRAIHADRSDPQQLAQAFEATYDAVIDCICYRPDDALAVTALAAGRTGQFIFTSTVDVYPKPAPAYPVSESVRRAASPRFPYAVNKIACEEIVEAAAARGDFAATILRPAATYSDQSMPIAPPVFRHDQLYIDRNMDGLPIVLQGDGSGLWASAHRDEVAAAFVAAIGNASTFGSSYHVTGSEWLTWNRYWQIVAEAIGAPEPNIVHIPTSILERLLPGLSDWCVINFQHNNVYDNSAARRDLGFAPAIAWRDGVERIKLRDRPRLANPAIAGRFEAALHTWEAMVDATSTQSG